MNLRKRLSIVFAFVFLIVALVSVVLIAGYKYVEKTLPQLITVADYQPLLVSQVYDRHGKKIGEFFRERRTLIPFAKIPKNLTNAFLAAEDDQFYKHGGLNYLAILRAAVANLRAGKNVQGASTITQQVAKTLLLSSEKTYLRKIKEALLAQKMEDHLSKDEILYLYLNQIYFGQGAYGVVLASQTYFRKSVDQLTLAEMAMLGGLPKAPSAYSPVHNSIRAKERQVYVLNRMAEVGFITKEQAAQSAQEPVRVYLRENYKDAAPFFLETVRQVLVNKLGEESVLDKGLHIETSLDLSKQLAAQESSMEGLKELDKRQGYRGPASNTTDPKLVGEFLLKTRDKLMVDEKPEKIILPNGHFQESTPLDLSYDIKKKGLPFYLPLGKSVPGIVSKVDDQLGVVYVKVAELQGLIDIESMQWARKPNAEKRYDLDRIQRPSQALKMGDIILVKVVSESFGSPRLQKRSKGSTGMDFSSYLGLNLDQEPIAQAALLSIDQETQDILAMIGGTDFEKSEYNRALQAARQTGSSFKSIVYASALDHGFNPSSLLMDAPIVYEEGKTSADSGKEDDEGQGDSKVWKPANHSKTFGGDITFRNALVKSLNIPAVKVIEDLGINWPVDYARRLGIFSPLNLDFTLVLGSSSVTLYEMTKVFSEFGRQGKRTHPILIHKVEDSHHQKLLENVSLDERFSKETADIDKQFADRRTAYLESLKPDPKNPAPPVNAKVDPKKKDPPFFFEDEEQLIKPTTAYLITSLLKGVVEDPSGTGARARALGREVAGKTGTTNGYYDAWFLGYTPQIATGVWVGFDQERTLGKGEVGGRAALPIWLEYMKSAHADLPALTFPVPAGIVFVNIDADTGQLPAAGAKRTLRQAFLEGTEPTAANHSKQQEDTDFYKQDLSE